MKNNSTNFSEEKIPIEIEPTYTFVDNCLKDIGIEAIYTIGQQGGYFFIFDKPYSNNSVSYYLY